MRQELEAFGASGASGASGADLCVVNTCTVTNQADADARRFIRRARRMNPHLRIIVAGCSSALDPDRYRAMEGVAAVVEGHDPMEVARSALMEAEGAGCHPTERGGAPGLVQLETRIAPEAAPMEAVGGNLLRKRRGGTRGWLKIQDGCDRKCSFCATRLARGESRSRPLSELVAEAQLLARSHPELVLTGIHIGHFGRDLGKAGGSLSALVACLLERVPDVRFRLGSVEATEIDDELLDLVETSGGRVAPHFHMPMQSGSDSVLRRMRRWHTREMYRRRALEIAGRFPVLGLGADIITGFPGETDQDHALTRALVGELPFTYLHVFPYSPREGTPAAELHDPVPQRVAGERGKELRELAGEKGLRYREARVGDVAEVVLEGDSGWALTEDYLRVRAAGSGSGVDWKEGKGTVRGRLRGSGEKLYIDLSQEISN
jgi:threonylcarbamoyladenosine tRNA methylthiotransferase MtaB